MCNGGRIVHHLKHGLFNKNNHVIFVGYQAHGTLGRRIVDGQKILRVAGEEVRVQAEIHTINGFSAHGDQNDLIEWAQNFKTNPTYIITHGEPESSIALAKKLKSDGKKTFIPKRGDILELISNGVQSILDHHTFEKQKVEDDIKTSLRDIARMATFIEENIPDNNNIESLMPLIISAKTLLETAEKVRFKS